MNDRDWLARLEFFGIKLGLDTIAAILAELDLPHTKYPVIHLAGTNGKGSVAAMVSHALTVAGRRTGRYTSPHLVALEERFALNGRAVAASDLDRALHRVRGAVATLMERGALDVEPTYFEITTAAAFEIFCDQRVDIAVVEVGLGGRLDATNVVAPAVTAITSIDLDHEAHLGPTLAAIATEKAGIIKPGVPVIVGALKPEALRAVATIAAAKGAPLVPSDGAEIDADSNGTGQYRVTVRTNRGTYGPVDLGLRGRHQIGNAVIAALVLEQLPADLAIDRTAVETGLRDARWPGRLDLVAVGGRTVLVDGAHNPAGARALASYLSEANPHGLPIVFGVMADKRAREMLAELLPFARPLIVTRAPGARAADPQMLASMFPDAPATIVVEPSIERALATAWSANDAIAVAGSLYLAGEVYRLLDVPIA
jgi:dihydrofolate synthase / folylpolyglutamate synthase